MELTMPKFSLHSNFVMDVSYRQLLDVQFTEKDRTGPIYVKKPYFIGQKPFERGRSPL